MVWTIKFDESVQKKLHKLDKPIAKRIINYLKERIAPHENPRRLGDALKGELGEFWRYRVGDYRIICQIEDETICILVLEIGNRRDIYK